MFVFINSFQMAITFTVDKPHNTFAFILTNILPVIREGLGRVCQINMSSVFLGLFNISPVLPPLFASYHHPPGTNPMSMTEEFQMKKKTIKTLLEFESNSGPQLSNHVCFL